ncbi:X8 [Macleaya cordata]|uniref:X8 n=1 Tax=Macleaya cordata TaxID=56857 RepID=A0A200Q084_MACCD|nr:X8 [Macleaya cordata]
MNCDPIKRGGNCSEPNNLNSYASFVMNRYYQTHGRQPENCYFNGNGLLTPNDPSHGICIYDKP